MPEQTLAAASVSEFNDSHFHLTNYIQKGIDVRQFLQIMGTRVGRSTLFGIPLQQQWSYANSGDFAPTYYLHSDAPLYYYSFTDAYIASVYRSLSKEEQSRFDPMITGFNPADMYAVDHIRRVLTLFPGVFTGIGEFSIHKEFVSSKILGETASLTNPALDRIFELAAEVGLVVIIHNDIDMPFATENAEPVYLTQMTALLKRHPNTTVIWAHLGLGRVVHPVRASADAAEHNSTHVRIIESMLADQELTHVSFDISWDEVAKYAVATPESVAAGDGDAESTSRSVSLRHRHRRARRAESLLRCVRQVEPDLARPDAGGQSENSQTQLRESVRSGARESARMGTGARSVTKRGECQMRQRNSNDIVKRRCRRRQLCLLLQIGVLLAGVADANGQTASQATNTTIEVYGFAMLDMGHDFNSTDPDWFDVLRVSKLPAFDRQFGEDNNTFSGVRQSRLGVRTTTPTSIGELRTTFEFELFGTGVDAGQTTFRLRHAYGELGEFGAGQTWSPFMDPDVFPNSLEYWGPTGMVFFRNLQVRWMPTLGDTRVVLALERPGASGDAGIYANRIELQDIRPRFPFPDVSGAIKLDKEWGYARVAGIYRLIKWDDVLDDRFDLSGDARGWGINFSGNVRFGDNDIVRLQYVFGEAIENYMNDAPVDIGVVPNLINPLRPIIGEPLPITGIVAFLDHTWSEKFASSFGYSRTDIDNTMGQVASAYRRGQYALGNLTYYPVPKVMFGGELQWGRRDNFSDGFSSEGLRLHFAFRYNFSFKMGV